jgi:hypothetical protein
MALMRGFPVRVQLAGSEVETPGLVHGLVVGQGPVKRGREPRDTLEGMHAEDK